MVVPGYDNDRGAGAGLIGETAGPGGKLLLTEVKGAVAIDLMAVIRAWVVSVVGVAQDPQGTEVVVVVIQEDKGLDLSHMVEVVSTQMPMVLRHPYEYRAWQGDHHKTANWRDGR